MIAREALATLYEQCHMLGLVHRDYSGDFTGNSGDTITIRKPATFTVNEFDRSTGIVLQDATEGSTSVTLDTIPDVSFAVTAEDWSLKISDFSEQFLAPAMEAVSQWFDRKILALRTDVTQTTTYDPTAAKPSLAMIQAGKILNDRKVPLTQRYGVWDTAATATFQADPLFHDASMTGDDGTALREASFGRKHGLDNYMSQNVADGNSLVFHRSAFAAVTRTLPLPRGIGQGMGSIVNYKGLGLRVIYGYDQSKKQDVVSIDTLAGFKTLDAARALTVTEAAPDTGA
ncbi:P22 phage major capsid protein family protein [Nocardiopsis sp. HUAS JQ3]|nr:P22 phage major capsid protein family protein [Nocardiopsis sp. HUAS JQ3]